jgi:hypothetical protein
MQFEKNKDGRITKEEMSANPFVFGCRNANQDGIVTAGELSAYERAKETRSKTSPGTPEESSA